MKKLSMLLSVVLMLVAPTLAVSQSPAPVTAPSSRGQLLYLNHCIACHSATVHWRDRRLATDFASLIAQVGRWEKNGGLAWSSEEVLDVVRYLNTTIYRFPDTTPLQQG